jgi:PEP-CTERM motif
MPTLVLLVGLALSLAPCAAADPITLSGSGAVTFTDCDSCAQAAFGFTLAPGDEFTFRFTLDNPTVSGEFSPPPGGVIYSFAAGSATLSVDTRTVASGPAFSPQAFVAESGSAAEGGDGLAIALSLQTPRGPVLYVVVGANDPLGTWLSSTALPIDLAATMNAAPRANFEITFSSSNEEPVFAAGPVQHFEQAPAPIPEPSTLSLIPLGLAGLGVRRWRQRRA